VPVKPRASGFWPKKAFKLEERRVQSALFFFFAFPQNSRLFAQFAAKAFAFAFLRYLSPTRRQGPLSCIKLVTKAKELMAKSCCLAKTSFPAAIPCLQ
jgi:hypothetical protein